MLVKITKFAIFVVPLIVIVVGLFALSNDKDELSDGNNKAGIEFVNNLDYDYLKRLASERPNGEKFLNFIDENVADIRDDDSANDVDAYISLGFNLRALGDDVLAIDAYKIGLSIQPTNTFGLNNLATSYRVLGDLDNAEEAYRKLIVAASGDADPYINLAEIYVIKNPEQTDRVVSLLESGLEVSAGEHRLNLLAYLGSFLRKHGDIKGAIEYFEMITQEFFGENIGIYEAELEELKEML
jgi:tetratricopeptide (TPR) repeat protein